MESTVTLLQHADARELFAPRIDGELPPDLADALQGHLESCAECRLAWNRYERAVSMVRALPRARAPRELSSRVLARVRRRRTGPLASANFTLNQVSIPIEAAIPVVIAAIVAAILLFAAQ